jgi:FG-GAP-like repeat/FG-GAP repeat
VKNAPEFKKTILTTDFISEGIAVGDINKDGKTDIIAGYYWFEAPSWKRHEIAPSRVFDPTKEYSNSFLNLCLDVNLDGWIDLVLIDFPGQVAFWFENPKNQPGRWPQKVIGDSIGIANESPSFVDVDRDGRLDILCGDVKTKQVIWLQAPVKKGQTVWTRFPISDENCPGTERFSHGLGYGDINKDGKNDVILTAGWLEGPANTKQTNWLFHPGNLGEPCSHMHAFDVNADGRNDVVSASAHKLGIWWYEQVTDGGNAVWKRHLISEAVSQTHASVMADMNGDGKPDFITGKRYLAHHNSNDPGTHDPSLLLWFESTPGKVPFWSLHEIDNDSGAGLNIVAQDMNKDGRTDIVIANKKGVFLFENMITRKNTN